MTPNHAWSVIDEAIQELGYIEDSEGNFHSRHQKEVSARELMEICVRELIEVTKEKPK